MCVCVCVLEYFFILIKNNIYMCSSEPTFCSAAQLLMTIFSACSSALH